jgi:hypothetical protein
MRPHAHTALLSSVTHACCPTTSSHFTTTAPLCDGAGHSLSTQVRDAKFPMPRLVRLQWASSCLPYWVLDDASYYGGVPSRYWGNLGTF